MAEDRAQHAHLREPEQARFQNARVLDHPTAAPQHAHQQFGGAEEAGVGERQVDDDGTAYNYYSSLDNDHTMSIDELSANFTAVVPGRSSGLFGPRYMEGGVLFKRGDTYYATSGSCCCFCRGGAGVAARNRTGQGRLPALQGVLHGGTDKRAEDPLRQTAGSVTDGLLPEQLLAP